MSKAQRQSLGCGYEPEPDRLPVVPWSPPDKFYGGPAPTVCAGYSCNLPEVVETAGVHPHWEKGSIVAACGGEQPTEEMLVAVTLLNVACSEVKHWASTPTKDGGGGG